MAMVPVSCRLGKYDLEACLEYLGGKDLQVEDISCKELEEDGDAIQWTFRSTIAIVDLLR
jgi:hypothetical protein